MNSRKHKVSSDNDGQPSTKSARRENQSFTSAQQHPASKIDGLELSGNLRVEVKLRSESKAAQNDPDLTPAQRETYKQALAERPGEEPDFIKRYFAHNLATTQQSQHGNPQIGSYQSLLPLDDKALNENNSAADAVDISIEMSTIEEDDNQSEYDEHAEFQWLEHIDAKVISTLATGESRESQTVGNCAATLIRRGQIRQEFYAEMEQPSEETSMLAFALFDRYGRLRTEFKEHPFIKGNGVWGSELDHGDIVLIEEIYIEQAFRRRQLGRKMMEQVLALARQKTWSFYAFVRPGVMNCKDIAEEWNNLPDDNARSRMADRERDRAISFYRALGFRRVGSTGYFAFASDDKHPSHKILSTEDFDPSKSPATAFHPSLSSFGQFSGVYVNIIDPSLSINSAARLMMLKDCYLLEGSETQCWMSTDKNGNNILHILAAVVDYVCIEWILRQEFGNQLLNARNKRGEIPLEVLEFKLEKIRTQYRTGAFTACISDKFNGYSDDAGRCLALLQQLINPDSDTLRRLKRGCTCGKCLDGFLSPRMVNALQTQAEMGFDTMNDDVTYSANGSDFLLFHEHNLNYLPSTVRANLVTNKTMRQGFTNLWKYVANCLEQRKVPNEHNVLEVARNSDEWPPATTNFVQRGGRVEHVFLAICHTAMESDECTGDGSYQEVFAENIDKLPQCRNDLEFGYVSGLCGYRRISFARRVNMRGETMDENGNVITSLL